MATDLISFHFPEFFGYLTWIEVVGSLVVLGLIFFWRSRKPSFSHPGFFIGVGVYLAVRTLVWIAGPGYHFKLHTYGVLIALGFVMGIIVAVRQAKKESIDPNLVLDLVFWILISAMVGSRVLFIIVNINEYIAEPLKLLQVWKGGLVFYGGFIGAVAASMYFCKKHNIAFLRIADLMIPSLALGHFFGRLGCFSAGCCHGCPTGSESFGVIFQASGTVVARSGLLDVPIHPTQLYEAFGELMIFMILLALRRGKRFNGQLLATWLMLYPAWRFMTEMFRGDSDRGLFFRIDLFGGSAPELLSTSQLVSVGLVGLGVFLFVMLRRKKAPTETPSKISEN
jgi:phosphatidylglycerol---prolipoprotein diacylglyceryl transferase